MKKHAAASLVMLTCGALLASGCAKHDMVKKDQGIAPVATAARPAPAKQQEPAHTPPIPVPQPKAGASASAGGQKEAKQSAQALAVQQAEELKRGLQKVYFSFDSAQLSADARNALVKNAELIKKSDAKIRIEGNCDERGSDDYNLALGERRAKEAAQYLANLGIASERLSTVSYGKEKPADPGHDEASWSKNRRDELIVVQ